MIVNKHVLDRLTAMVTGEEQSTVAPITAAFLRELANALSDRNDVHLRGFGKFRLSAQLGAPPGHAQFGGGPTRRTPDRLLRFRVQFSKSRWFSREVRRKYKEKSDGKVRR